MVTRNFRPGLKGEPDEGDLKRESHPSDHLIRQVVAALSSDGALQVGRPDDDEKDGSGHARPPIPAPQSDSTYEFGNSAGIDKLGP
jgi:hypothetical protein